MGCESTDEPIFWSDLLAKGGHTEVGVLIEQSLVGEAYLKNFRDACRRKGIRIVAEASIAQTAGDVSGAVQALHDAKAQAIVHCGFGFGIVFVNPALEALGWDPPRFCALERVKMMPAASGAPGTRVSFGNWSRRAWVGAGYLVARRLDADGVNSHLVDRFGEE